MDGGDCSGARRFAGASRPHARLKALGQIFKERVTIEANT